MLTVNTANLPEKTDYTFIVSKSATPPDWDSVVKDNPARITRAFDNENLKSREIYFSATDNYQTTPHGALVNLVSDSEGKYPGLLTPDTAYYIYAYKSSDGSYQSRSAKITTASYPGELPPVITNERSTADPSKSDAYIRALWGMDMWERRPDGSDIDLDSEVVRAQVLNLRTIQLKAGEVVFLPFRTIPMHPASGSTCILGAISGLNISYLYQGNPSNYNALRLQYPQSAYESLNPGADRSVLFTGKFGTRDYYDVMHGVQGLTDSRLGSSGPVLQVIYEESNCSPTSSLSFYRPGFGIDVVTE